MGAASGDEGMIEGKRILVVDDSSAVRRYLRTILARRAATVNTAATGQEALDKWRQDGACDLVLLDLLLPDTNGIDVLKEIRQTDEETAIVILTGMGDVKSAITAVQHGADSYVEKQDLAGGNNLDGFFYVLEQALEHRAGLVAARQLQEVKAEFYSMVTHDLRNPAGLVLTSIEMLYAGDLTSWSSQQVQLLEIMQIASKKMLNLIDEYLDYAKIDAGYLRVELADVDLRDVLDASLRTARVQIQAREQTLSTDVPVQPLMAEVDVERFGQVMDNLLSNAVKYTPTDGNISVQLRETGGYAVLSIGDTGMGIPQDRLSSLFTKYHRLPGEATRGIHGTGLGLLIVKEVVEAHGGTVWAESEGIPGKGSTFWVKVPLKH